MPTRYLGAVGNYGIFLSEMPSLVPETLCVHWWTAQTPSLLTK